jgi:hypothetical protein
LHSLYEGLCLIYAICVCLCIMVPKTYYLVFLFCFSSSCVPYVASFSVFLFCFSSSCVPYVASFSVFLFCFSSSCVPYVASFSGLLIFFYCPFGILICDIVTILILSNTYIILGNLKRGYDLFIPLCKNQSTTFPVSTQLENHCCILVWCRYHIRWWNLVSGIERFGIATQSNNRNTNCFSPTKAV